MSRLLVVAGEGSGDAFAAPVVTRLGVKAFGVGGPRLAAAGVDLVANLSSRASMGIAAPLWRVPGLALTAIALARAIQREDPSAALLVGFSEVNAWLARWLRRRGTRVLWFAPPQVWAWRAGRAAAIARSADQLAVVLPFEVRLWRNAGANVEYVGHPALEDLAMPAGTRPSSFATGNLRLALLPGSRSQEISAHLERFVGAARKVRERRGRVDVTLVRAPGLDARTALRIEQAGRGAQCTVTDAPLRAALHGHDVAIGASGTATLECAVLAVPPVIVYRTDPLTYAVARRVVRVPHIGLPNIVLGRRAFPELIQDAATPHAIAEQCLRMLERREDALNDCVAVRRALEADLDDRTPSARVADLLCPWLA